MTHYELHQMNLYFLFSFLSVKQFMFLLNNNAIGYSIDVIFFASRTLTRPSGAR